MKGRIRDMGRGYDGSLTLTLSLPPQYFDEMHALLDMEINAEIKKWREHIATASKDVTFLDKYGQIITPELGKQLAAWLDDGVEPARCEECGSIIKATSANTIQQIMDGTMKNTGKHMCAACYKEWRKANAGDKAAS